LENHYCNLVYESWFEEAVLRGRVPAPGFMDDFAIRAAYLQNKWVGPSPGQIDPTKETTAALDRIGGRLSTIAEESAAIGGDFDQNIVQIAYEENTMDALDVKHIGLGARGSTGALIATAEASQSAKADASEGPDDSPDNDDEDETNKSTGDK
jgi:capsid protein